MGKRLCLVIVGILLLSFLVPFSVYAVDPDDPDSTSIPLKYVNRSLIETGDLLIVCEYDLAYAALPTDNANVNYIFRLIDTDGITELGQALPYPYKDKGYNHGVVSYYFTKNEMDGADNILGNADDLFAWGDNLIVRMSQNPAKYTTPQDYDFTIDSSDYTLLTSTADNQMQLAERLFTIASRLEGEWAITLTESQDTGFVFSSNGEAYFRNAIVGCQAMAPDMFFVMTVAPDTSTRAWGTSLSDTYKKRLYGVDGLPNTADDSWIYAYSIKPLADLINVPTVLLVGLVVLGICVFLIYKSNQKWATPMPGYVGSLITVLCAGMLFLGLQVVALLGFGLVIVGSYLLFLRKA